jgi:hypothetical protein
VPTGIVAVAVAMRVLRDSGERIRHRLDMPGMIALGLGLFGILWAMTKLANAPLDASMVGYLVGGVVMLAVFVLIEPRAKAPMLPLSLFRVPAMAASLLASLFQGLASFAVSARPHCTDSLPPRSPLACTPRSTRRWSSWCSRRSCPPPACSAGRRKAEALRRPDKVACARACLTANRS